ncbi:MAG TPA: asparaginase domain-containing protein [Rhodothermales bacterium]|nr:asparaginase domain-containing protein [Rhodothermales bacterium]HRR07974.1 asparaginase domain-containing protein [Rhodothermales bacterium]
MITIFTTGGTIDKVYFDAKSEFEIGDPMIGEVLREANVTPTYEIRQLMRKDSLEITDTDRQAIFEAIEACPSKRIIITHGTDTMVKTAQVLAPLAKSRIIVLVGSLSPARFRNTDAVFNIGFAMGVVQALEEGVYVSMNGCIFHPDHVVKNRAANRFEAV